MINQIKVVLKHIRKYRINYRRAKVIGIISLDRPPDFSKSEAAFDKLQSRYSKRPEYGYDTFNIFSRASVRAVSVLKQPGLANPGLKGFDIGAGDGMLGVMLQCYGHHITLGDLEDWRVDQAKKLPFVTADFCDHIPIPNETFDFIVSFNSFEHFSNPNNVMEEIIRILRPKGLMYFDFNPLYCSPWGLHAYRSLRMPYPQFLFREEFINQKLKEIGIMDLGSRRSELQTLNRWKSSQFKNIWNRREIKIISWYWTKNEEHLNLILEFPECFWGRNLSLQDLVHDGVTVILQKL